MIILGLDIGTTRSKAACIDETARPQIVLSRRGDPYTPSAVYFEDGLRPIVGVEALAEGALQPDHVRVCFKRTLGSPEVLYTDKNGKPHTATELQAILIAHLREDVEQRFSEQVDEAVICVPANFKDHQKQATLDAARLTGLNVLRLVHEPTAAGIAYAIDKDRDQRVVIFDLGGGTFDVSVLEKNSNQIKVLNTAGCERLGGEDFNQRLQDRLLEQFAKEHKFRPSADDDPLFMQELRDKAEQAKLALTDKQKTKVVIGCRGRQSIVEITRPEFEQLTADLREQALRCTSEAVSQVGLKWSDVDSLIMVGGSVRMPAIQFALAELTGLAPRCDIEPDRAVVYGTALQCAMENAARGKTLMVGGRVIPAPKAFVQEVMSHSVGCCVAERDGALVNAVILPKGTAIPAVMTDRFALQYEDQTQAQVEILQGQERDRREGCLVIGEIVMTDLPTEAKRSKRIEVTYSIDKNGMIHAVGKDLISGKSAAIDVDYRAAMSTSQQAA